MEKYNNAFQFDKLLKTTLPVPNSIFHRKRSKVQSTILFENTTQLSSI